MVQEETIELIMELKEKGVYFAVATGRNYDAVYPVSYTHLLTHYLYGLKLM